MFRYQFKDLRVGEFFLFESGPPLAPTEYVYQKIAPTAKGHNTRTPSGNSIAVRSDCEVIRLELPPQD